jgi:hypothetical protein
MIRFAPEVRVHAWTWQLNDLFAAASTWALREQRIVVVTSIDDSAHGAPTLHGFGLAVDLDTEGSSPRPLDELYVFLARLLPPPWVLVLELDHLHVEWDAQQLAHPRGPRHR